MGSFGVPEVLFGVGGEDFAGARYEVRDIVEFIRVFFEEGAGDDADVEFFCKGAVGVQVLLVFCAEGNKVGIYGVFSVARWRKGGEGDVGYLRGSSVLSGILGEQRDDTLVLLHP